MPTSYTAATAKERLVGSKWSKGRKYPSTYRASARRASKRYAALTKRRKRAYVGGPNMRMTKGKRMKFIPQSLSKNVFGILNPHSPHNPRLMDGAVTASQTHSNRHVIVTSPNVQLTIWMGADLMTPLVCNYGTTEAAMKNSTSDFHLDTSNMTKASNQSGLITKAGDIERWRCVSQGLKIRLLNTTATNDGYFQAFRVHATAPVKKMVLKERSTNQCDLRIETPGYLNGLAANALTTATEKPSYIAGALKDIDQLYFKLNPMGSEHPMVHVPNDFEITDCGTWSPENNLWYVVSGTTSANGLMGYQKVFDALHDKSMDMICIVITPGSNTSQILLDLAQNLEVVYDHESPLVRYHQPTEVNKEVQEATHKVQQQNQEAGAKTQVTPTKS